jgi:hypothetical protein
VTDIELLESFPIGSILLNGYCHGEVVRLSPIKGYALTIRLKWDYKSDPYGARYFDNKVYEVSYKGLSQIKRVRYK